MNENTNLPEYSGESVEQNVYRTGSTEPPKSRKGLFAFLLGTGIFLCGMVSALSLLNIRVTQQLADLQEPELCTVAFCPGEMTRDTDLLCQLLGFSGEAVPTFWQRYDRLPSGIYITQVDSRREAALLGIRAGDILLALDGRRVQDTKSLEAYLCSRTNQDSILLTLYRKGELVYHRLSVQTQP